MSNPLMFITHSVNRIYEMAEIFGLSRPKQNLKPTINHWNSLVQEGIAGLARPLNRDDEIRITVKLIKYKLDSFIAAQYGSSQPEPPFTILTPENPAALIGGKWRRFTESYLLQGKRRMEFISSIKHIKGGLPRPPPEMLLQAEHLTVEALTAPQPDLTSEEWTAKNFIVKQLQRTVNELFGKKRFKMSERLKAFFPSTSANYNMSRSQLGALYEVAQLIQDHQLHQPDEFFYIGDQLVQRKDYLVEIHKKDRDGDEDMIENQNMPGYTVSYDASRLKTKLAQLNKILEHRAMREIPNAEPQGLAEAMKVRVITKGPPITYTYLKPIQRFMHRTLKQHPVFQLIGNGGVSAKVLYSQQLDYMYPHEKLNSGDYNDATNKLKSWVSEVIVRNLSQRKNMDLSDNDRDLMIRALTGHVIRGKEQTSGQLMGSIVSFPVLCIANAALCRAAMEYQTGKPIRLDEARLLINGDDCLFPISDQGREFWIKMGQVMGLEVNVAKSFHSSEFCNINSRDYTLTQSKYDTNEYVIEEVPFINAGLMYGYKRSEGRTGVKDIVDGRYTLGASARELMKNCPWDLRKPVMDRFIANHPELFETTLPWHIPEWAGGVGLPDALTVYHDIDDNEWETVKYKRDLAGFRHLLQNWDEYRPRTMTAQPLIDVHLYAQRRLQRYTRTVDMTDNGLSDNTYKELYGLMCCEWLFTEGSKPESLENFLQAVQESSNDRSIHVIRHNEKLWGKILSLPNLPPANKRTWEKYRSKDMKSDYLRAIDRKSVV